MIHRLRVRGFQSLKDVDVELGQFTVVVGPSSSGKSALVRAIRVLASNVRGTSHVTRGSKVAFISAEVSRPDGSKHVVSVERGEGVSRYHVDGEAWSKCGTTVPPEVTRALGLPPLGDGGSPGLAGQFDRPFLLDESGGVVARVLGEVTGVEVVLAAAREGNRRLSASRALLKAAEEGVANLRSMAERYVELPAKLQACAEAEEFLAAVETKAAWAARLRSVLSDIVVARAALARAVESAGEPVPDVGAVETAAGRLDRLRRLLAVMETNGQSVAGWTQNLVSLDAEEAAAHREVHDALVEAGTCPLCGQETSSVPIETAVTA